MYGICIGIIGHHLRRCGTALTGCRHSAVASLAAGIRDRLGRLHHAAARAGRAGSTPEPIGLAGGRGNILADRGGLHADCRVHCAHPGCGSSMRRLPAWLSGLADTVQHAVMGGRGACAAAALAGVGGAASDSATAAGPLPARRLSQSADVVPMPRSHAGGAAGAARAAAAGRLHGGRGAGSSTGRWRHCRRRLGGGR